MSFMKPPKPVAPPPPPNPAASPVAAAGGAALTGPVPSSYSSLISTSAQGLKRKANVSRTSLIGGS